MRRNHHLQTGYVCLPTLRWAQWVLQQRLQVHMWIKHCSKHLRQVPCVALGLPDACDEAVGNCHVCPMLASSDYMGELGVEPSLWDGAPIETSGSSGNTGGCRDTTPSTSGMYGLLGAAHMDAVI